MRHFARVFVFLFVLCATVTATYAQGGLNEALLAEGGKNQVIQFNPTAALQSRIFADRFVPNSSEISLSFEGADYAAQRAESLSTGAVRVYYVRVGDWSNVKFTQGGDALGNALIAQAQAKQVIQFNPSASLQQRMFADGFVPNSAEFSAQVGSVSYAAQRSENLGNGQVRVYYVVVGDWNNVRNTSQNVQAAAVQPAPAVQSFAPPVQQPAPVQRQIVGGSAPCLEGQIKGNRNSDIYHVPSAAAYSITTANVACYDTEAQAQAAGFRRAQR